MSQANLSNQRGLLILDFGAQYTQLIARTVRELGVYCEILPYHIEPTQIEEFGYQGIILSGSHASAYEDHDIRCPECVFSMDIPVLGICYGMQTMVSQLGGEVECASQREYGYTEVDLVRKSRLIDSSSSSLEVWMSHGDRVKSLPSGFQVVGQTKNCPFAIIADSKRHFYGVQFHPEVSHTTQGRDLLARFSIDICGCENNWTATNIIHNQIEQIRKQVGTQKVILGLSGGVDSSVVAVLLHQAIGEQLICIFVDTGLLRVNEGDEVMQVFSEHMGIQVLRINAAEEFFAKLKGVYEPEAKRKIIGNLFVEIFEREAEKIEGANWLAQGTIYPDVIESAGGKYGTAKVIKSHHNVGGLPQRMKLTLLEPLRELFKDEVRKIGHELGLPEVMINRHPFPGPGLGVRILGEVRQDYAEQLRLADAIFIEELRNHNLYDETSQAFAVFLPIKSVGVVGDNRAYEYVIALRAVETIDFMTANWKRLPYELLDRVSNRIINEVRGISRVTYDISGKPPATVEWE
ncbi:MAG: glutamine-hydrolyzing GMP synthase [Gammaproteobacteria bacterium]|nr:glutamine-hydrolyzing GMP synthase [Gammaproteobacteria bacterium]MCY4217650.1 glutamine-hydrolyzing GMP synthase [Gammaproteobacteria bacterium]MCY4275705.1 glutamine-hydrolyzing GMP synthase [Gammaproteobacteria bacterium]